MATNPKQVELHEMAARINDQFGRYLDDPISERTPYDWWKRTKNETITEPMPQPIIIVGRSPVFRWADIVPWFVRYKGIGKRVALKEREGNEGEDA